MQQPEHEAKPTAVPADGDQPANNIVPRPRQQTRTQVGYAIIGGMVVSAASLREMTSDGSVGEFVG